MADGCTSAENGSCARSYQGSPPPMLHHPSSLTSTHHVQGNNFERRISYHPPHPSGRSKLFCHPHGLLGLALPRGSRQARLALRALPRRLRRSILASGEANSTDRVDTWTKNGQTHDLYETIPGIFLRYSGIDLFRSAPTLFFGGELIGST